MKLQFLFFIIFLSTNCSHSVFTMNNNDFNLFDLDKEIKRLEEQQIKIEQEKKKLEQSRKEIAVEYALRVLSKNSSDNKYFSETGSEQIKLAAKKCCETNDSKTLILLIIHGLDLNVIDENGIKLLMRCSEGTRNKIYTYIRSLSSENFFNELCTHHRIYKEESPRFLTFLKILKRKQIQTKCKLPKYVLIYLFSFFGMLRGSMSEIYYACFCSGESTKALESLIEKWTT